MDKPVKRITIKEFVEAGYLQEVNRQFFHPLGLALEVMADDNHVPATLGGIWDCRDDPEGMAFADGQLETPESRDKASRVGAQLAEKAKVRQQSLGYIVQPVGPREPLIR